MAESDSFHHVRDFPYFELPFGGKLELPAVEDGWSLTLPGGYEIPIWGSVDVPLTKFMLLQVVAFVICFIVFRGLARNISGGKPASGRFWNFWEAVALFIRDEVVRPTIGDNHHHEGGHGALDHPPHGDAMLKQAVEFETGVVAPVGTSAVLSSGAAGHVSHPADQYLPFVWSCFFYILICNLLGAIPMLGSPTGSLSVTAVLAGCAFVATTYYGFREMGVGGFFGNLIPESGVPGFGGFLIGALMFVIELFGLFVKHGVLAVRLFANIMGGHTVVGVILGFIALAAHEGNLIYGMVLPASILGQVFIGLLELFVSFLQAYVFAFLLTIFIAGSIHKH